MKRSTAKNKQSTTEYQLTTIENIVIDIGRSDYEQTNAIKPLTEEQCKEALKDNVEQDQDGHIKILNEDKALRDYSMMQFMSEDKDNLLNLFIVFLLSDVMQFFYIPFLFILCSLVMHFQVSPNNDIIYLNCAITFFALLPCLIILVLSMDITKLISDSAKFAASVSKKYKDAPTGIFPFLNFFLLLFEESNDDTNPQFGKMMNLKVCFVSVCIYWLISCYSINYLNFSLILGISLILFLIVSIKPYLKAVSKLLNKLNNCDYFKAYRYKKRIFGFGLAYSSLIFVLFFNTALFSGHDHYYGFTISDVSLDSKDSGRGLEYLYNKYIYKHFNKYLRELDTQIRAAKDDEIIKKYNLDNPTRIQLVEFKNKHAFEIVSNKYYKEEGKNFKNFCFNTFVIIIFIPMFLIDVLILFLLRKVRKSKHKLTEKNKDVYENYRKMVLDYLKNYCDTIYYFPEKRDNTMPMSVGENAGEIKEFSVSNIKFVFRWCPAGAFQMGMQENDGLIGNEMKPHSVKLTHGFWIMETPVTVGMFRAFVNDMSYDYKNRGKTPVRARNTGDLHERPISWENPFPHEEILDLENHPVTCVSWYDAAEFCKWLTEKIGHNVTLPTEAQWEYSCRAGSETPFCWGGNLSGDKANCNGTQPYPQKHLIPLEDQEPIIEAEGSFLKRTTPVKHYEIHNNWGLYDMHGNVWEWCLDCFVNFPNGIVTETINNGIISGIKIVDGVVIDPKVISDERMPNSDSTSSSAPGSDPHGPERGGRNVRGGRWFSPAKGCRSADRDQDEPTKRETSIGFRCIIPVTSSNPVVAVDNETFVSVYIASYLTSPEE